MILARPPGSPLGWPLPPLVVAYVQHRQGADHLYEALKAHVGRVASRYPDAYFELGRRSPESLSSLSDRVFCTCAATPLGRAPFHGRPPFRAYAEDHTEDARVRGHSFYDRWSLTRERLRDQYHYNLRHDPVLRERDELYRKLGPILSSRAVRVPGKPERWTTPASGPREARTRLDVVRRLRELARPSDLDALVLRALDLYGAPVTRSELTHAMAEYEQLSTQTELDPHDEARPAGQALGAPLSTTTQHMASPGRRPDQIAVRAAVRRAWDQLDELDRALLVALARGAETPEILAADPRLQNRVQLSRAVDRVGLLFVRAIVEDLGGEPERAAPPRELLEQVAAVLALVLPELSHAG